MNTITGWDALEFAVDHLADVIHTLLDGPDDVLCSLRFEQAEAVAKVLEAGLHADTAAHLMHRWALTEPDWDDAHGNALRRWLALDVAS